MNCCRTTLTIFLCASIFGCASVTVRSSPPDVTAVTYTPVIHNLERSVGKLRRLAVLPIQLEVSPKNPKACLEGCGWVELRHSLGPRVAGYLRTERGYDVTSCDDLVKDDAFQEVTPKELQDMILRLLDYAQSGNVQGPPDEVSLLVKDLAGRAGVDGLVLIHGSATSFSWWDWALAYASFTLSFPLSMMRVGVSLRADIFEASTGRIVWGAAMHAKIAEDPVGLLFEPIEPAVPRVLTRPAPLAVR